MILHWGCCRGYSQYTSTSEATEAQSHLVSRWELGIGMKTSELLSLLVRSTLLSFILDHAEKGLFLQLLSLVIEGKRQYLFLFTCSNLLSSSKSCEYLCKWCCIWYSRTSSSISLQPKFPLGITLLLFVPLQITHKLFNICQACLFISLTIETHNNCEHPGDVSGS